MVQCGEEEEPTITFEWQESVAAAKKMRELLCIAPKWPFGLSSSARTGYNDGEEGCTTLWTFRGVSYSIRQERIPP